MPEKGRLYTGARARLLLDGVKVGYATNVSIGEEIQLDPVEVIGNIQVEEFVPVAYRVTFSASHMVLIGESIKSRGWFPALGTTIENHLENILVSGSLQATIEDIGTGKVFAVVEQVKVSGRNYTINARGAVGEDVTFVAIRVRDQSEVA